jgi:hypothetical protein
MTFQKDSNNYMHVKSSSRAVPQLYYRLDGQPVFLEPPHFGSELASAVTAQPVRFMGRLAALTDRFRSWALPTVLREERRPLFK